MTTLRRLILVVPVLLSALAFSTPAHATTNGLEYLTTFNGNDKPGYPQGFQAINGISTVNKTNGNVYVAENVQEAVDIFDSTGKYLSDITSAPSGKFVEIFSVAVDGATGTVYIAAKIPGAGGKREGYVYTYNSKGEYQSRTSEGFDEPYGMAVEEAHGKLYVGVEGAIEVFSSLGEFAFTIEAGFGHRVPSVAVDQSNDDLYVHDSKNGVVDIFTSQGALESQFTGISTPAKTLEAAAGIAVDDSTDSVYVIQDDAVALGGIEGSVVDVFTTSGEYLYELIGSPLGGLLQPEIEGGEGIQSVAVNELTGSLYVATAPHASGGSGSVRPSSVDVFGSGPVPPVPVTGAPSEVGAVSARLNGVLDPGGVSAGYYFVYRPGPSCTGGTRTPIESTGASASDTTVSMVVEGLLPSTEYSFCLDAIPQETAPGASVSFMTSRSAPGVGDRGLSALVGETGATLDGVVNPFGEETTYYFNYGLTEAYGSTSTVAPGTAIGSGIGDVSVKDVVSGLVPNTTYHYQLVAINPTGETKSGDAMFTTLPFAASAETGGASEVVFDSARVGGSVNPGSVGQVEDDTTWCFQYGTTPGYGLGFAPVAVSAGQGVSGVPVSVVLSGLQPATTYHYRLVAVNAVNVGQGASGCGTFGGQETLGVDRTFTTSAVLPVPSVETGAVSEVSPNTVLVSGSVNPGGVRTGYAFQIGVDTSYGAEVFGDAGSGTEPEQVTLGVGSLQPGTIYHYRLVAHSQGGTSYGRDETFRTATFPSSVLSAPLTAVLVPSPPFPTAKLSVSTKTKKKIKKRAKPKRRKRAGKAERVGGAPRAIGSGRKGRGARHA